MGMIFNLYSTLYDGFAAERYQSGTYERMIQFVKDNEHGGLYLAKVDIDEERPLMRYLFFAACKAQKKSEELLQRYKGEHISQVPFEVFNNHSFRGDGAIIVNRKGILMDDHRLGRLSMTEWVCEEAATGAGHTGLATLSLWPRISTYVCSHENTNMVTKFVKGKIAKRWTPDGEYIADKAGRLIFYPGADPTIGIPNYMP